MNIAYVTPIYPMPSQTFIRREIIALESLGFTVHRFSLRRFAGTLADEADRKEQRIDPCDHGGRGFKFGQCRVPGGIGTALAMVEGLGDGRPVGSPFGARVHPTHDLSG